MSIYRGAGGASDATDDSTVNAVAGYASAAASSASSAATSATNASNSATAAASSASSAASSASSVAANASNAASSAGLANTYATAASASKDAAAASAATASTKAGEASTSASNAATSASTASTQATNAASSASAAATSASAASTSASNAASSAASALAIYANTTAMNTAVAAAATSATNADTSADAAYDAQILAEAAVTGASLYADAAQASANNAQASATSAASAAATAAADAVTAAEGELTGYVNAALAYSEASEAFKDSALAAASAANISATSAASSATSAATSATNAAASAASAAAITGSGNGTFVNTPITTNSTITLSEGRANGVAYLNGSKVLTTGPSLTFDGSNISAFGSFTSGTTGVAGSYVLARSSDGAGTTVLESLAGTNNIGLRNTAGSLLFSANNAEGMRLTSTGLGIGTSSPTQRLEVNGAGQFGAGNTTSSGSLSLRVGVFNTVPSNATDAFVGVQNTGGPGITAGDLILMPRSSTGVNNNIIFLTGQTTPTIRATLDSSGYFGLGVTPSAWSGIKALQVSNASVYGNGGSDAAFSQNAYYNAGWKYISTAAAAQYQFDNGAHKWFYAASGTAGNAITFTQAMTLDASGRLAIGATSASNTLDVAASGGATFRVYDSADVGRGLVISAGSAASGVSTIQTNTSVRVLAFGTNSTERMRLDSSGNLLVGLTSAATSSAKTIHIANATVPTANPTGGGVLYVEGGALKYRGSSGTITTIAAA